jgi:hypothetical protein
VTGWTARLLDGSVARESDGTMWCDVKDDVAGLSLASNGVEVSLPAGLARYVQWHGGSCPMSGGEVRVEDRCVGFQTPSGDEVIVRIPESGGKVILEVSKCRRR